MTWRHVIKSLLFKPDSQLCVIFTQFTPAFTPRRVELRIVVLFLSLFSRGEAKDQLSVSVCRCLSLSVVVQVWINSEVCPPSWTLLSGAETKLLWPALMKTDRDVTLGWTVTMATATSLRSVFSASVVGSSRGGGSGHCWSEDWWGEWSKPWSCPQHLRVSSMGPDPEWRSWPGPDLCPIQDWEAPEVGLVERCLQGLPKECTMMVNSTHTHTHTRVMHCGLPVARLQTVLRSWSVPQ